MSQTELIAEQRAACLHRLDETVGRIRNLLAEDVRGYPERESRRRFLADPVRADTISDGALAELRKGAIAAGTELAATVSSALASEELWRQPTEVAPSTRDLRQVAHIWAALAVVDVQVEAMAERFGLGGDDRDPPGYAPPARFIGGQHLPTLVESYLRELATLTRLAVEASEVAENQQQRSLSDRWAKAADD